MRSRIPFTLLALTLLLTLSSSCSDSGTPVGNLPPTDTTFGTPDLGDITLPDGISAGPGVGEMCNENSVAPCRTGLVCTSGVCQVGGSTPENGLCTLAGECADGLTCNLLSQCVPAGEAGEGDACSAPEECQKGLRCDLVGFTGVCQPEGSRDWGASCTANTDCLAPLVCNPTDEICAIPALGGLELLGQQPCDESEVASFTPYFEVPRGEVSEFYRLPFPNDIRREGNGINMDGYFRPELNVLGADFINAYLDVLATDSPGFSPNPTLFFRFSRPLDFESIASTETLKSIYFVNVDPDSPNFGRDYSLGWFYTTGRGNFICQNYLTVRPPWNEPLEPGTTYAVFLTTDIRGAEGEPPEIAPDLAALLSASAPSDSALMSAWNAYAPLRTYLDGADTPSASQVATATVFTTLDPRPQLEGLRAAARAAAAPELSNLTLCDSASTTSPCSGERACIDTSGDFVLLHATYNAPVWQQGIRPYLTAADGGNVNFDLNGQAVSNITEELCLSITIPTGEMPANGWPVVMFSHGTGGGFQGHVSGGTAARLANISLDTDTVRVASIAIDGVQHSTRRGDSTLDPEVLFYNFANPLAARGNVLQGAGDYFTLMRIAETFAVDAGASPTGSAITFDPNQIYFFGHSQGATVGALFAPYEPNLKGAIFSGSGGSLTLSLLNKTNPVDIAAATRFVLNEGDIGDNHPFLNLLQTWIDPVDPLNHARFYVRDRAEMLQPLHVFQSYGIGDTFSPEATMSAIAGAMNLDHGQPGVATTIAAPDANLPLNGNRTVNESPATAAVLSYTPPSGVDGHFVIFQTEDAIRQSMAFLASAIRDGVPTIPR